MGLERSGLVSVIMPVYNREATVRDAVQSILEQTYEYFELIIVDDASTDCSASIIQGIEDRRIRFYSHETNKGGSAARNTGILMAQGKWIAFQDSDDIWKRDKLEKQMNYVSEMDQVSPSIIYTSFIRHKDGKQELIPQADHRKKQGDIHKELIEENFISTQTVLLPKECFNHNEMFAEDLPRFQDWELWLRLSLSYRFVWIEEPLVDVFYTEESISSNHKKLVLAYEKILDKHQHLFEQAGSYYLASYLCSYGHNLCLAGDTKRGRKVLFQAYRENKKSLKCFLSMISCIFGTRFYKKLYSYYNR
ncbi:glycosyltransferase [Alkalihalobacillus sp. MEB130]|uniref:glycosyltransferase family 2 protein n=1 Tax=Alkalihalobacillus sp. MEB130 TaxID=2976704 RepID=UPI0028DEA119|nr:glycosyltransferase family 2 protein [Alkalihalobacillus sp. MEB130]MDT8860335.1 glycosyltransferase [Alkalihalobacillus sp. MEB130]